MKTLVTNIISKYNDDNIMKYPKLAQLINYALSEYAIYNNNLVYAMSNYPNILTDIIYKNPNVMNNNFKLRN